MLDYAKIISLHSFSRIRNSLGKIVCTSGGFDPIHPGHTSCIIESKKFGDTLVVIVNGDSFLIEKKGRAFMNLRTRSLIVSSIRNVDYVIPFKIEGDLTVVRALQSIRPHVFTKGGDCVGQRTIPEWKICLDLNIDIVTGVGWPKEWSSSNLLAEWGNFWASYESKDRGK